MRATVRGSVLLYAVTALLLAAHDAGDGSTLFKLGGLTVLFFAAYRYNLAEADATGHMPAFGTGPKIALTLLLMIIMNILPAAHDRSGVIRDNCAFLLVGVAFFATRPLIREYGFLLAWLMFNAWLVLSAKFSLLLAPLFIAAACYHRYSVTAHALGEEYNCPEHGATRAARGALLGWLLAALLLFLPFQLWGWWEEGRIQPQLTTEERALIREKAKQAMPAHVGLIGVAMLVLAGMLWRQLRQQKRGNPDNRELQEMLSAQGFTRELAEPDKPRFTFPGGARGKVLKLYEHVLAAAEKKLKRGLRTLTPAQREAHFRQLDAARPWPGLTTVYNRARYGNAEITDSDVAAAEACARHMR